MHPANPNRHRASALAIVAVIGLLNGCGEDPMGPENRLALMAWGRCQPDEALRLADLALAKPEPEARYHALVLKAAMRREAGDSTGAEALYPRLAAEWQAAKDRTLSERRRERDIAMRLTIAESERHMHGHAPDCGDTAGASTVAPRTEPTANQDAAATR